MSRVMIRQCDAPSGARHLHECPLAHLQRLGARGAQIDRDTGDAEHDDEVERRSARSTKSTTSASSSDGTVCRMSASRSRMLSTQPPK